MEEVKTPTHDCLAAAQWRYCLPVAQGPGSGLGNDLLRRIRFRASADSKSAVKSLGALCGCAWRCQDGFLLARLSSQKLHACYA